jgi:hypothetical protein
VGVKMTKINLTAILISSMGFMTGLVAWALYLGHNGTLIATALGIFGVIVGAVAKTIYDKGGVPVKPEP